jgi:hypothetical protein
MTESLQAATFQRQHIDRANTARVIDIDVACVGRVARVADLDHVKSKMNEFGNTSSTFCGLSPVKWSDESPMAATRRVQNPPMTAAPITSAREGGPTCAAFDFVAAPIPFHSQQTIQHPTQISKEEYATAIHSSRSARAGP